jgi:N utilization substance protein B
MKMGVRRKAREMALQALYTMDLIDLWEEDFSELLYEKEQWPSSASYASKILSGILEHHKPIDEVLEGHAEYWSVSRMNLIDRNILRIATYELLFCDDVPMRVSINEAIELGKMYGTPETKRFLNGILDRIAKAEAVKSSGR